MFDSFDTNIHKKKIDECKIIDKHSDLKFVLSYIRYIDGFNLDVYIHQYKNQDFYISLINTYYYLINSLQILNKNDIIHFDIKGDNILHDSVAIIIDFGLSIKISDITVSNLLGLRQYFYTYATDYYIWSPEIHFISYIVLHNVSDEALFNLDTLTIVLNDIVNNNRILTFFSNEFKILYRKSLNNFMNQFINKLKIFLNT